MFTNGISTAFKLIGQSLKLWWDDWSNGILVSLVMLFVSLTVILAGPAILGMCAMTADFVDGIRTGIEGWWTGFKRYFWQGILWGMFNLILAFLAGSSLWFYTQWSSPWAPLLAIFLIIIGVVWLMVQFLAAGYLVEQEDKSIGLAWKNSFLTLLTAPGFSLVIGLFSLIVFVFSVVTLLPVILGTGPLLGLLSILAVRDRLAFYRVRERQDKS
jgi:putative Mn2+ efflux pump MntP